MASWKSENAMINMAGSSRRSPQRRREKPGVDVSDQIKEDGRPSVESANDPMILEGDIRFVDGKVCKKVYSGRTIQEFFGEKGPGFAHREEDLPRLGIANPDDPQDRWLDGDRQYYVWEPVL